MSNTYKPLYDRVIVRRDEIQEKQDEESLIIMPTHVQEKPSEGTVVMARRL